ncbi:mechanosensitive ion channel domain-containing protein [uncultured Psychromonas sp.]|uniref:mechanosensitive ion channel domain-containing protein n=1 Tax=uncultured Psychromonas sp. TaxID=173974 RepID=UPI00260C5D69|nr:mechanosensitive ion channel domain-containing protein [uncultured Psychromonas sp.]
MSLENLELTSTSAVKTSFFQSFTDWTQDHNELILSYIANFVVAILIVVVGLYIARILSELLSRLLTKKKIDKTIVDFLSAIARYTLIAMTLVAGGGHLGIQTASFVAIIAAAGLAIGLALKGALSNFAAGILLVTLRPFKIGNFIEAAGTSGTVESIQIFHCILRTGDNKHIVVPNAAILKGNIVNVSRKPIRRIDLIIRVSYQSNLKHVKQVLEAAVLANDKVLTEPGIQIAVSELAHSSVNVVVRPWVKSGDYWSVRFALTESIKNALDSEKIKIPYPQMDVHRK